MKKRLIIETSQREFLNKIRKTEIKGYGGVQVYKDSDINIVKDIDPDILSPCQTYVLRDRVKLILGLREEMLQHGIDLFQLETLIKIDGIPFAPPIIERDVETGTNFLINDGMHRCYAARSIGLNINILYAQFVNPNYPYYAYPLPHGWSEVHEIDQLTVEFKRKKYRDPDNYKLLFRDFDSVFPGIQETRPKQKPTTVVI